jgi:hypothetical protein
MKDLEDKSPVPWDRTFWSLEVLESGMWPLNGPDGKPLDNGKGGTPIAPHGSKFYSAVVLFLKGDMEFMCVTVGLPSWSSNECCGLCRANRSDKNFKDMRRCALWRPSVLNQAQFVARFRRPGMHPLLERMCKLSFHFWCIDLLHITDYHGVAAHCIANVVNDVVRDNELGVRSHGRAFERPPKHRMCHS